VTSARLDAWLWVTVLDGR